MTRLGKGSGVLVLIAALTAPAAAAHADAAPAAKKNNPFLGIPVSGTSADNTVFSGTLDIGGFISDTDANGNPIAEAVGALSGTITPAGGPAQTISGVPVLVPVQTAPLLASGARATVVTCQILHLVLGPLDLNLLGLMVHLNQVVLDISAQPGPGNLLGNLLCAIANLLNGFNLAGLLPSQIIAALVALLNQLITLV